MARPEDPSEAEFVEAEELHDLVGNADLLEVHRQQVDVGDVFLGLVLCAFEDGVKQGGHGSLQADTLDLAQERHGTRGDGAPLDAPLGRRTQQGLHRGLADLDQRRPRIAFGPRRTPCQHMPGDAGQCLQLWRFGPVLGRGAH